MGYDVQIEIDKSKTGGTFTNYDIISGVVKLTTTTALTLSYIQVKLEGVAETQLVIPGRADTQRRENRSRRDQKRDAKKSKRDAKDKFRQDTHKILYDSVIVFPPENVRNVSQSKDFTLAPGTYTHGFQFKIPLSNSCKKLTGISNKILFSKNNFDLVINNGNFNSRTIMKSANNYILGISNPGRPAQGKSQQPQAQEYHIDSQLPPSLPDMNGMASIKYFVKVTCKRSSILKANMRAFDPFVFLPLDLNNQYSPYREGQQFEEYRERFFRKEVVFKNRLPEVVGVKVPASKKLLPATPEQKGGSRFFGSFFASGSPKSQPSLPSRPQAKPELAVQRIDVPFAFEMRMPHPPSLSPTTAPTFKLYLVSEVDPAKYSLADYGKADQSNGLGIVYLQSLKFELTSVTILSVLDNDGNSSEIHQSRAQETLPLCYNTYQNLQFDLRKCKRQRSSSATSSGFLGPNAYELEIPSKYYENFRLPRNLAPTFHTCNIARGYGLSVVAGFSSEKVLEAGSSREVSEKVRYVDIFCPDIQVLSGLKLTSNLHSNASGTSLGKVSDSRNGSFSSGQPSDLKPPLPERRSQQSLPYPNEKKSGLSSPTDFSQNGHDDESAPLPTYDDVVRESSYQDDSEHQRARYRYGA
ncbi:hypothetical protein METBIDRAFT_40759 [Metschnikowia bicuspidata var. bicuspidata NRRL YB-4993]|uniref:Arrestin-like N-terminal domain-containing protein n=1 Tax=Metschnikowia bicuspidata var. bicuspidata NRRL YB-4993 TaxID=869754 RepID=A0A1A0HCT3_9ASCO|nr:hypothetical protein METBIDRAFT_40759 [Metschnikowia bicuspidata var. bicuspidata NRRL YB-4993]OBA21702.1 hypothetical protein METBIDRAFT_40759 [Metschnikowia bicuspidata var. bicuspidata NRRL YB-4993]